MKLKFNKISFYALAQTRLKFIKKQESEKANQKQQVATATIAATPAATHSFLNFEGKTRLITTTKN